MKFIPTQIPELFILEPRLFGDDRGFFMETYRAEEFARSGIPYSFVQDNHSGSHQGILRGLHYQIRQPQGKLIRVVAGEVFDVAVDIRPGSPTFGKSEGLVLSAKNRLQLWVPPGFAHGFYVISEWAEVVYKATDYYAPQWERGLRWNDPALKIPWPIPPGCEPILSVKDAQAKLLAEADLFD